MWITAKEGNSTEIENIVVERVLSLYPEEELINRNAFRNAFATGSISFEELQQESAKILIPWQMFLLNTRNLDKQMAHIEKMREHKMSAKLMAKRPGEGDVTSKRIVDRLIRQQNFVTATNTIPTNPYCGCLKARQANSAADKLISYFEIDLPWLWNASGKGRALQYLINRVESRNINVSRGVLTHKILPHYSVVPSTLYKNTSGFAIKDSRLPFVFLPGEVNPDEVESRQIYTLIYLLVVIGLDQYEYMLEKNFKATLLTAKGVSGRIHRITSEVLMPTVETNMLVGDEISIATRDELASKYKVSPTALITTLRIRNVISKKQYDDLIPPAYVPNKRLDSHRRSPKIATAVKKFCGKKTFTSINSAIANKALTSTQAQYLIFGAINKKGFLDYRRALRI